MMLAPSIGKNSLVLALFAVVTTSGIAATYLGTRDRIAEQERIARAKALLEVIPTERHNNSLLDDTITVEDSELLGLKQAEPAFRARQDGEFVGVILPVLASDGYSGDIKLIVGINADGSVAGVRVLSHNETPGLGDKVDLSKSEWILDFNGKSLQNPLPGKWAVKKDKGEFDQFTGATITPRAVVAAVRRALEYYQQHQTRLARKLEEQDSNG